ncbi:MAG: 3-deoxy-D-manno-octulosonic acid transferase [Bacteroidota bacterium]
MSVVLYNIFLLFFRAGTRIASLFNPKAKKWLHGRKRIFEKLQAALPAGEKIVWMHCASLGEFEQGRPVIEKLKSQIPNSKTLLTFFSPSGYEVKKDYKGADWVFYLPLDGPRNARRFLEIVHPSLVIFVKYEFWYYYLKKIKYRNIPLLLISALFRKDMSFFKWYGGLQRKILSRFDHLFVQNENSKKLLEEIGLRNITSVSGDTRFDRVIEIAEKFKPIPFIEQFIGSSKTLVAGSTWPEDEEMLHKAFRQMDEVSFKLIITPHEIDEKRLGYLKKFFPSAVLFSELSASPLQAIESNYLIIDNFGMLSRLYRYGYITYVGGGLKNMGVHNVLEAAVHSRPVLVGPYYHKYIEAVGLVNCTGATVVQNENELAVKIKRMLKNEDGCYANASAAAGSFVKNNAGATQKILNYIEEKRLLTS